MDFHGRRRLPCNSNGRSLYSRQHTGDSLRIFDTIVIGGGAIGLSIAYELKLRAPKMKIAVLDKGQCGREASWAAAGMLVPELEWDDTNTDLPRSFFNLSIESLLIFEDFVRQLEHVSGVDCELRKEGILKLLAAGESPDSWLERYAGLGVHAKYWDMDESEKKEPALAEGITGIHFPNFFQIDNRKLVTALVSACKALEVEFFDYYPMLDARLQNDAIESVECDKDSFSAAVYVLAAGAWSSVFSTLKEVVPEVRPVKGQMSMLQMPNAKFVRYTGLWKNFYYVPRNDGRILIGSTVEDAGFMKTVSDHVIQSFHDTLESVIPNSVFFSPLDKWSGLRPATPDLYPALGSTRLGNLKIATGHYRNGILLTPITARLISEIVAGEPPSPLIQPFTPLRFFKEMAATRNGTAGRV